MSEQEPTTNQAENEKIPLDQELRNLAIELGFQETPEIQEIIDKVYDGIEISELHEIFNQYEDELEKLRSEISSADFLVAAALESAALQLKAGNIDAAFNNLADASDILNGEQTHPELLDKIEAIKQTL